MIQKLVLKKGQPLSQSKIFKLCSSARNTYDYIRIQLWNRKFILVSFHRDQTLSVSHNFTDLTMYYATMNMMNRNKIYSTDLVAEFLYKTIKKYNQ